MLAGDGGLKAYFGTPDAKEIEEMALAGDQKALTVYEAMAYQVAKWIGAMYTVLMGNVDAILITGGIANSKWFINKISERTEKLAPIHVFPGGDEMEALAMNVLRVVKGEEKVVDY